jgi:hypothetical protein
LAGAFTIFLLRQAFMQVPTDLWEAPISGPLPEDTFFLPRPR